MNNKIDFRDFTGWVVVYKTTTRNPFRVENWLETANSYEESIDKANNAIREYFAHDIIIYYVVDGIAEKVINDFQHSNKEYER